MLYEVLGLDLSPLHHIGLDLSHIFGGLMIVGILGFFTLDRFFIEGVPFFFGGGRRVRNGDAGWWLVVVVIVGVIRVQVSFYGAAKRYSAKLLRSAEEKLLEVGESYEAAMRNVKVDRRQRNTNSDCENENINEDEDLIAE
mmetsp:Transcript_32884/g.40393  ORF Transcript_32884/g.40393 Transcript_32884/m.40393 type:complete len:141 (+) Transcript_32884:34-456(+)